MVHERFPGVSSSGDDKLESGVADIVHGKLKDISSTDFMQKPSSISNNVYLPNGVTDFIDTLILTDDDFKRKMKDMCTEFYKTSLDTCFNALQHVLAAQMCAMVKTVWKQVNNRVSSSSTPLFDNCTNQGGVLEDNVGRLNYINKHAVVRLENKGKQSENTFNNLIKDDTPSHIAAVIKNVEVNIQEDDCSAPGDHRITDTCHISNGIVETDELMEQQVNIDREVDTQFVHRSEDSVPITDNTHGNDTCHLDVHISDVVTALQKSGPWEEPLVKAQQFNVIVDGQDDVSMPSIHSPSSRSNTFINDTYNTEKEITIVGATNLHGTNSAEHNRQIHKEGFSEEVTASPKIVSSCLASESRMDAFVEQQFLSSESEAKEQGSSAAENFGSTVVKLVSDYVSSGTSINHNTPLYATNSSRMSKRLTDLVVLSSGSEPEHSRPLKIQRTKISTCQEKDTYLEYHVSDKTCVTSANCFLADKTKKAVQSFEKEEDPEHSINDEVEKQPPVNHTSKRLTKVPKSLASPSFCVDIPGKMKNPSKLENAIFQFIFRKKFKSTTRTTYPIIARIGRFWIDEKRLASQIKPRKCVASDAMDVYCEAINLCKRKVMEHSCFKYCLTSDSIHKLKDEKFDVNSFKRSVRFKVIGINLEFCQMVMMPICEDTHWWLVVANMRENCFQVLNSLKMNSLNKSLTIRICNNFRAFCNEVLKNENILSKEKFPVNYPVVPSQSTICDCGIFVMKFIEQWDGRNAMHISQKHVYTYREGIASFMIAHPDNEDTTVEMKSIIQKHRKE